MAAQSNLPDYPAPPGNKPVNIVNIVGPSSYTQISTGSPPTGGQVVKATDIGMQQIEFCFGGTSDDGQYGVEPILDGNPAGGASQMRLAWYVLNTGAQVSGATNLSARTMRLFVLGR